MSDEKSERATAEGPHAMNRCPNVFRLDGIDYPCTRLSCHVGLCDYGAANRATASPQPGDSIVFANDDRVAQLADGLPLAATVSVTEARALAVEIQNERRRRASATGGDHEEGRTGVDVRRVREARDVAQGLGALRGRPISGEQSDAGRADPLDVDVLGAVRGSGAREGGGLITSNVSTWVVTRKSSANYLGAYEWVRNAARAAHFITREAAELAATVARESNGDVTVVAGLRTGSASLRGLCDNLEERAEKAEAVVGAARELIAYLDANKLVDDLTPSHWRHVSVLRGYVAAADRASPCAGPARQDSGESPITTEERHEADPVSNHAEARVAGQEPAPGGSTPNPAYRQLWVAFEGITGDAEYVDDSPEQVQSWVHEQTGGGEGYTIVGPWTHPKAFEGHHVIPRASPNASLDRDEQAGVDAAIGDEDDERAARSSGLAVGSQVRICNGPHTGATGCLDFIDIAGGRALVDCGGGRSGGLTWAPLEWVR